MRPLAVIAVFRTAMTIALSVILIHRAGAIGAAIATLVTEVLGLGITIVWSGRLMHVPMPIGSFAKLTAATVAMMAVMALLPSRPDTVGFATSVLAGLATYATIFTLVHARQLGRMLGPQHPVNRWLTRP
jgi:O-antigen/teichoic acid export membrane protein